MLADLSRDTLGRADSAGHLQSSQAVVIVVVVVIVITLIRAPVPWHTASEIAGDGAFVHTLHAQTCLFVRCGCAGTSPRTKPWISGAPSCRPPGAVRRGRGGGRRAGHAAREADELLRHDVAAAAVRRPQRGRVPVPRGAALWWGGGALTHLEADLFPHHSLSSNHPLVFDCRLGWATPPVQRGWSSTRGGYCVVPGSKSHQTVPKMDPEIVQNQKLMQNQKLQQI